MGIDRVSGVRLWVASGEFDYRGKARVPFRIRAQTDPDTIHTAEESVSYRAAVIASAVVIGAMFVFPAVVLAIFLPSLKVGLPNPIPLYERILLETASFCMRWRFVLLFPVIGVSFSVAAFTRELRTIKPRMRG
jgi:hypothetical protein